MKHILKLIIGISWFLSGIVLFDMFVLHGKLKLIWIALANTSDYSPFSTDGQSNYMFVAVFIIIGFIGYFLYLLSIKDNKEEK